MDGLHSPGEATARDSGPGGGGEGVILEVSLLGLGPEGGEASELGVVQFCRALGAVLGVGSFTGGGRGWVGRAREERALAVDAAMCAQMALIQEFDGEDGVPVIRRRVQVDRDDGGGTVGCYGEAAEYR